MRNIISYVREDDAPFDRRPFSAVDSLVLAQLAYLRFEGQGARFGDPAAPIAPLAARPVSDPLFDNVRAAAQNRALLEAVAASGRFGGLAYCLYANQFDAASQKQFAAITFLLRDGTAYVAFRGTDATVVGWKEDLNMAFLEAVPSQRAAVHYLDAASARVDRPLRVGGHSKGGNLAVYAAACCQPAHQARVEAVFSHDGPGFREDFFALEGYARAKARIRKTLPQSSIIGMLLEHQERFDVVRSRGIGIMQHDPFAWLVQEGDFQYLGAVSRSAVFMDETINRWVASQPAERRGAFINALYEIIRSTNAHTIDDLTDGWLQNAIAVLGAIRALDPQTRRFILYTIQSLFLLAGRHLRRMITRERTPGASSL